MNLTGELVIAGLREAGEGGRFRASQASSGVALEPAFTCASGAQVTRAVDAAAAAFPIYSALPAARRADFLRAIADRLQAMEADLMARAHAESGLPLPRLKGEVGRTCGQLRLFADLVVAGWWTDARIDRADPARPGAPKPDVRSMLRPLGPVVVFGASNFPLAFSVAGGDTASALAAGCPVIVKGHSAHPGTCELAATAILEAAAATGMPAGVFSMLLGAGQEVGAALVRHPAVRAVGFTGSRKAGRALMDLSAARHEPIPVYAEMGSVNPVVLLPEALATRAVALAEGLHTSFTLGVGQFCTNPGLVFAVEGSGLAGLRAGLIAKTAATPAAPMLTGAICGAYAAGLEALVAAGARVLTRADGADTGVGRAALLEVDGAAFARAPLLAQEVFGPCTLLVVCRSTDEILSILAGFEGQLTATVHGTDGDLAGHAGVIEALTRVSGRLVFNGYPTGVEVCHAMVHGGPYPACSDPRSTSVGTRAIQRFARPVCWQNAPQQLLPDELKDDNPAGVRRLVDGRWT